MKHITLTPQPLYIRALLCTAILCTVCICASAQSNLSYIRNIRMLDAQQTNRVVTTTYLDGLGREYITEQAGASTSGKSIYTMKEYDQAGREQFAWLPIHQYSLPSSADSYKTTARSQYADQHPYQETVYEPSPLDRPSVVYGPGDNWNGVHGVRHDYRYNTYSGDYSCKRYEAGSSSGPTSPGNYAANQLSVAESTDEDGNRSMTFTDKLGRTVLERRFFGNVKNDTYYVYDVRGNLVWVLQPEYQDNPDATLYAFRYTYDGQHRKTMKQLPGGSWEKYTYDKAGRMMFSQDTKQSAVGVRTFYLYDKLGRLCMKGLCTHNSSLDNISSVVTDVSYAPSGFMGIFNSGYILNNFSITVQKIVKVCYYDTYAFRNISGFNGSMFHSGTAAYGKLVGEITSVLDSDDLLYSAYYYDSKGRVTEHVSTDHTGGYTVTATSYNFTDAPVTVSTSYYKTSGSSVALTTTATNSYDGQGRLSQVSHSIGSLAAHDIARLEYDALGRTGSLKHEGSTQLTTGYQYNLRGWTTALNNPLFSEQLFYDSAMDGSSAVCFNGNISASKWKVSGENCWQGFRYAYDDLDRLTMSQYVHFPVTGSGCSSSHGARNYSESASYSKNGNILNLTRYGKAESSTGAAIWTRLDDLDYGYSGNRLTSITDNESIVPTYYGAFHFAPSTSGGQQYAYDVNGNMTKDLSRNIQSVEYNMLNLPRQITFSDGSTITNMYDADGRKLRTTRNIVIGGTTTSNVTDYCGNLILEQGIPSRILTGYGYASITSLSSNQWTPTAASYSYYIKDHLGSVRIVANSSGSVLQKNTYYAFGGLMSDQCTSFDVQPYRFQGKELDRTMGLEWNDHGARFADMLTARWMTMDPLCEKYYSMSPYLLCGGNPVNRVDLHGDSITILDLASIDAIYNALQSGTKLSMDFKNGVLIPESIKQVSLNSSDVFLHDLFNIATNPLMVEIATTSTNDYLMNDQFYSDTWSIPSDIDYAKEFNNIQETELFPPGKTIVGNLGQTLYPISSGEYKRSTNNNIRININGLGNINQRSCGIAHEFGHVIKYINGQPHSHSNNADYIYGRQWNVMKRFGYDYLESPTGRIFK